MHTTCLKMIYTRLSANLKKLKQSQHRFCSWSVRSMSDYVAKTNAGRIVKDNSYEARLVGGSVFIKSATRLMHEGEWTCHVKNSLGSEKMKLRLVVKGRVRKCFLRILICI